MHPAVYLVAEHAIKYQHLAVPILFIVFTAVANVHGPVQHSLLVASVSWGLVWIPTVFLAGFRSAESEANRSRKVTAWCAGGLLALAQICERVACDKEGVWTTKGLLPVLVVLISENGILARHFGLPSYKTADDAPPDSASTSEKRSHTLSFRLWAVITVSASAALANRYTLSSTSALGLSSVIFSATGFVLFESALHGPSDENAARRGLVSANGTFSRPSTREGAQRDQRVATLRDVAIVMAVVCGVATFLIEPRITRDAISWEPVYRELGGDWRTLYYQRTVKQCLLMMGVGTLGNVLLFFMLSQQGAVHTAFLALFTYICARLNMASSPSSIWFTIIYSTTALLFLYNSSASTVDVRSSIRFRRIMFGVTAISVCAFFMRYASQSRHDTQTIHEIPAFNSFPVGSPLAPINLDLAKGHPAEQLISAAELEFENLLNRQSKSLSEAVQEYRRRNGIAPPPHFDKWYEFAVRNGVKLIDEFDTVSHSILPFWGLKPRTIRGRVQMALGNEDNALIGMTIRNGAVVKIENAQDWIEEALAGMTKEFVQYLPDMDLAFNIHDEPRVVVPDDQLSRLVSKAHNENIPAAMKQKASRNAFSSRPADMNDGKRFEEVTTSRFNRFAHQQTWGQSSMSCPLSSQARDFEENTPDNLTAYAAGPLNYIYNHTAFSDVCNSPSFSTSFGFFERPNAFNIIHELIPIFSPSKISSFQDILYPSPWYWAGRVGYDLARDTSWDNKTNSLYWRGSTTGGFSRGGGWRRQHRQHIVKRLNNMDKAKVLIPTNKDSSHPAVTVQDVDRRDYDHLIDVKFSHIGQCDPGDCDAQKEFFRIVDRADDQDGWLFKHLLDMDGNAFSGRFYSFLRSRSLTFKFSIFREWHAEWIRPWVHYVPLSLKGDEHLDLVRWFSGGEKEKEGGGKEGNGESEGEKRARQIAERSTAWAGEVLRNVDFEVWFWRVLLEYGRVIDDRREEIGYPGP